MKKLLIFGAGCILALSMCNGKTEYIYRANYIFKNATSWDLTIRSYETNRNGIILKDSVFTIFRGGSHMLHFYFEMGIPPPLQWPEYQSIGCTIVSNGSAQVVQRRDEYLLDHGDTLYRTSSYTLLSESKRSRTYEFTFTDDFFDNAEPIPTTP